MQQPLQDRFKWRKNFYIYNYAAGAAFHANVGGSSSSTMQVLLRRRGNDPNNGDL